MEFYTVSCEKRPIRLSPETRRFAEESLNGKYGDEAMRNVAVSMDGTEGFETMSELEKYDAMIRKIAEEAPLRYCPGEKISGAATLGGSISHCVPAFYRNTFVLPSVSHLTLDFKTAVECGMAVKEREIEDRMRGGELSAYQEATLRSMSRAMEALRIWHGRYLAYLRGRDSEIYRCLRQVPFGKARNFREAVQSVWFLFAFERLCGNWPGIGRLDEILGKYLRHDLETGALTVEEAREILAHFFIKGCEWIRSDAVPGSGDAQHYQNIVLGGRNAREEEITNEATYLILDVIEELPIGDFPITVRLNRKTPEKLKQKLAAVIRHGGGIVAVYNEDIVLKAFERLGYEREEALGFANDGCWEVQIPGKTYFEYMPFDGLRILLHDTLRLNEETPAAFSSYEALYAEYLNRLRIFLSGLAQAGIGGSGTFDETGKWIWKRKIPCSVISLLEEGCIENARSYLESGTRYSVLSPHMGGAADTANSLYAIKKLVFEDGRISLPALLQAVKTDWKDAEPLRAYIRNKLTYYGNDGEGGADEVMAQLLNDFARITEAFNGKTPVIFTAGVSTFGRQIEWRGVRGAAPFGTHAGEILASNASPTPGTDLCGATAAIRSYCKADLSLQGTGAALDLRLFPGALDGSNGIAALVSLLDGFCALGGFFLQIDITDAAMLRAAQENPEAYKSLSVRVSGWNARFVTLDREWQQMIIERTEHML